MWLSTNLPTNTRAHPCPPLTPMQESQEGSLGGWGRPTARTP